VTAKGRWARAVAVIVGIAALLAALAIVSNRLPDRKRLDVATGVDQDVQVNERTRARDFRNAQAAYLDSVKHRNDVLTQIHLTQNLHGRGYGIYVSR
jgi:hypothetical protein